MLENFWILGILPIIIIILVVWSFVWKGMALWKSARQNDKAWFIILFIVNTAGILEMLYIFVFGNNKRDSLSE
jgi:hypothetical protein